MLRNLQWLFDSGRLAGTGYVSILPVDQGIEHSAGASFAPNPIYFDPENIVKLAIEGGCNAVASTFGVLGAVCRKYAHKFPFIVKLNHNELLTLPQHVRPGQFGSVQRAYDMGAAGVGATIYFGSRRVQPPDRRGRARPSRRPTSSGMFTVLWCYLRNTGFKVDGVDYHLAADLTAQANHLGVTIQADIIKQKLPENNGGYNALNERRRTARRNKLVYEKLTTDHPIDLTRYQVLNCYLGRAGLINSRRRVVGRERPRRGRPHRGHQQARGRHGPDLAAARPSSARWTRASSCSTRSRTSTSRRGHDRVGRASERSLQRPGACAPGRRRMHPPA